MNLEKAIKKYKSGRWSVVDEIALQRAIRDTMTDTKEYQELKDLYRSPSGFAPWNKVARTLVAQQSEVAYSVAINDPITSNTYIVCREAVKERAPVRYISQELAESFLRTPNPELTEEMLGIFPVLVIVVPEGVLITEDNIDIKVIVLQSGRLPVRKHDGRMGVADCIQIVGLTDAYSYTRMELLREEQKKDVFGENQNQLAEVKSVADKMVRIAINSLMVHLYEPELITTETNSSSKGLGFSSKQSKTRSPVWIGRTFRRETVRPSIAAGPSSATRGPVRPHWRRGHWHRVACGQGRQERTLKWYRPVFVSPQS